MTPWWANLISAFIGAIVGGVSSLWGVKIVQDRTDQREQAKLEAENARDLRKLESEKPSRLRPDRIAALYEIGEMLHDFDAPLDIIFDRSEHDDSYDWMAVAATAGHFAHRHRRMDIRVRLLFQHDAHLVDVWDALGQRLMSLDRTVEFGEQWVKPNWLDDIEANERAHWGTIVEAARGAQNAAGHVDEAIKNAMKQIDTE
jgi:hypothetical protein